MTEAFGIRFDIDQQRTIEEAWIAWKAKEPREGIRVDAMPPLAGPDTKGKMTMLRLPPEFVAHLQTTGLQFDSI